LSFVAVAATGCSAVRESPAMIEPTYSIAQARPDITPQDLWQPSPTGLSVVPLASGEVASPIQP